MVVSEAVTRAALLRKESRGAQFREDFPNKDPEWGRHNIIVQRGADGEMLTQLPAKVTVRRSALRVILPVASAAH